MKGIYTSIYEEAKKNQYSIGLSLTENKLCEESQFLNSKPEVGLLIGVNPMVGKGIDAEVDDLSFIGK